MSWFNFMIIIQVTNKVLIVFLLQEILLDTNTFLISTCSKKQDFYRGKIYFFQFQCQQMLFFFHFCM